MEPHASEVSSAFRTFEESIRVDPAHYILSLRLNFYVAVLLCVTGLVWFARSQGWGASSKGSRWRSPAALAIGAVALAAFGCGQTSSALLGPRAPQRSRIGEERPPHPKHLDVATPAQEKAAQRTAAPERKSRPEAKPRAQAPVKGGQSGSLPPASAGTNGSYVLPPPSERKTITPRTMARFEQDEAAGRAVLLNGVALAPPNAPEAVKGSISAANEIIGRPYVWGGGHASWYTAGYDCSGAVSYALAGGGFLSVPLTSEKLESWGAPGPGRWITVYANGEHTYAVIAGLRWDTVGDAQGSGPRWHAALPYPEGFIARHPSGF
jgi:cell wall-associated NlpC family hydrolase